jgi:hypothetical protein
MPLIIDAGKAAGIIRRGLERNKARIVFNCGRCIWQRYCWLSCRRRGPIRF